MGRLERRPREEEEAAWESRVQSEREFECLERVACVFLGRCVLCSSAGGAVCVLSLDALFVGAIGEGLL